MLTSLEALTETSGRPEKLRELVRERKQQGADLIKIFASKSIREGGAQTMTDAQLQAACGEAKALGLRAIVHAHSFFTQAFSEQPWCTHWTCPSPPRQNCSGLRKSGYRRVSRRFGAAPYYSQALCRS